MKHLFLLALLFCLSCASCKMNVVEDSSAFALKAGQSTLILGSTCSEPLALGYSSCPIKVGQKLPTLFLFFMNPAEYAVSDCDLGVYKTGSISQAGEVQIDLAPLTWQVDKDHFCLLRVEAIERYPDPKDPKQLREIPLAAGFFVEQLDASYFPDPPDNVVSWCYQVKGTNKGRRKIEACK
jgi:hypothetical protein